MKTKLFYFLTLLFTVSCTTETDNVVDQSTTEDGTLSLRYGGDGKFDLLGHGCDVAMDFYAGKLRVIDNDKLSTALNYAINPDGTQDRYEFIESGSTATSFLKKVTKTKSINIGSGNPSDSTASSKANISSTFVDSKGYTMNYSFAQVNKVVQKMSYTYTIDINTLKKYLSSEFKLAVANNDVNKIITDYGTHVYSNVILGGKLSITYRSDVNTTSSDKMKTTEAGASAIFKKAFNIDVKYSKQEQETATKETKESSYIIRCRGGNVSIPLSNQILNGNDIINSVNTQAWENSIGLDPKFNSLIDFKPGTLIPLWEFLEPGTKRDLLRTAIIKHIKDNELKDLPAPRIPLYQYSKNEKIAFGSLTFFRYTATLLAPIGATYSDGSHNDGIVCYVDEKQKSGTVPLYEYTISSGQKIGFYYDTQFLALIGGSSNGFSNLGIAGYIYKKNESGTVPLYQYSKTSKVRPGFTFVTFYYDTLMRAPIGGNCDQGHNDGIVGYVFKSK